MEHRGAGAAGWPEEDLPATRPYPSTSRSMRQPAPISSTNMAMSSRQHQTHGPEEIEMRRTASHSAVQDSATMARQRAYREDMAQRGYPTYYEEDYISPAGARASAAYHHSRHHPDYVRGAHRHALPSEARHEGWSHDDMEYHHSSMNGVAGRYDVEPRTPTNAARWDHGPPRHESYDAPLRRVTEVPTTRGVVMNGVMRSRAASLGPYPSAPMLPRRGLGPIADDYYATPHRPHLRAQQSYHGHGNGRPVSPARSYQSVHAARPAYSTSRAHDHSRHSSVAISEHISPTDVRRGPETHPHSPYWRRDELLHGASVEYRQRELDGSPRNWDDSGLSSHTAYSCPTGDDMGGMYTSDYGYSSHRTYAEEYPAEPRPEPRQLSPVPVHASRGIHTNADLVALDSLGLGGANAKILCVADVRGNLDLIDELADRVNAAAVIHTGDFGFFEPDSLDRLDDSMLRRIVQYSPLLSNTVRAELLQQSPDLMRERLKREKPFKLSQLPEYLSGRSRFQRPVYVVWGEWEDIAVLERFRNGLHIVKNLKILDEVSTHLLNIGGLHLRLLGLGGAIIRHKLFDHGDACAGTMAGGGGKMWASLLQLGELIETARRVTNPSEVRILVTHTSPGKEPLVNQLALALRADYSISSSLRPRYPLIYTPHAIHPDFASFEERLIRSRDSMLSIWHGVQKQVESQLNSQQRVLLDYALSVIYLVPSPDDDRSFKGVWCLNLPEVSYGQMVFSVANGKISLVSTGTAGVSFSRRLKRHKAPTSVAESIISSTVPVRTPGVTVVNGINVPPKLQVESLSVEDPHSAPTSPDAPSSSADSVTDLLEGGTDRRSTRKHGKTVQSSSSTRNGIADASASTHTRGSRTSNATTHVDDKIRSSSPVITITSDRPPRRGTPAPGSRPQNLTVEAMPPVPAAVSALQREEGSSSKRSSSRGGGRDSPLQRGRTPLAEARGSRSRSSTPVGDRRGQYGNGAMMAATTADDVRSAQSSRSATPMSRGQAEVNGSRSETPLGRGRTDAITSSRAQATSAAVAAVQSPGLGRAATPVTQATRRGAQNAGSSRSGTPVNVMDAKPVTQTAALASSTTSIQQPIARMAVPTVLDNEHAHSAGTASAAAPSIAQTIEAATKSPAAQVSAINSTAAALLQKAMSSPSSTPIQTTQTTITATSYASTSNNVATTTTIKPSSTSGPADTSKDAEELARNSKLRMAVNAPEFIPGSSTLSINPALANNQAGIDVSNNTPSTGQFTSMDSPEKQRTLWCGGLYDVDYTEDDIRNFFSSVGGVESVHMVTDPATGRQRQFCFVTFVDSDTCNRALMLGGNTLLNRQVTLRLANLRIAERLIKGTPAVSTPITPKTNRVLMDTQGTDNYAVQHSLNSHTEELRINEGVGLEEFPGLPSQDSHMVNSNVNIRHPQVQQQQSGIHRLWVGGLSGITITDELIRRIFEPISDRITNVKVLNEQNGVPRSYCFVDFADEEAVRIALTYDMRPYGTFTLLVRPPSKQNPRQNAYAPNNEEYEYQPNPYIEHEPVMVDTGDPGHAYAYHEEPAHQATVIDLRLNKTSHVREAQWTSAETGYMENQLPVDPQTWNVNAPAVPADEAWDNGYAMIQQPQIEQLPIVQTNGIHNTINGSPLVENDKQENPNTLWLGGFYNDTVTEEEVRQFFGPLAASIVNVKLMFDRNSGKQRAFCFVEFDCAANRDEAMKLSGRQLKGHTIKLNRAVRSNTASANQQAQQPVAVPVAEANSMWTQPPDARVPAVVTPGVPLTALPPQKQWGYGNQSTSTSIAYNGFSEPIHNEAVMVSQADAHIDANGPSWLVANGTMETQPRWVDESAETMRVNEEQIAFANAMNSKQPAQLSSLGLQTTTSWADTPGHQEQSNPFDQVAEAQSRTARKQEQEQHNNETNAKSASSAERSNNDANTATTKATNATETSQETTEGQQEPKPTLWIGNFFNETVSDEEMREFLGPYAEGVTHIKFMFDRKTGRQRPFCFVEFASEEYLVQALQLSGKKLKSVEVKVNRAGHKDSSAATTANAAAKPTTTANQREESQAVNTEESKHAEVEKPPSPVHKEISERMPTAHTRSHTIDGTVDITLPMAEHSIQPRMSLPHLHESDVGLTVEDAASIQRSSSALGYDERTHGGNLPQPTPEPPSSAPSQVIVTPPDEEDVEVEEEIEEYVKVTNADASEAIDATEQESLNQPADTQLPLPNDLNKEILEAISKADDNEDDTDRNENYLAPPMERSSSRVSMSAELSEADRSASRASNRNSRTPSRSESRNSHNESRTQSPVSDNKRRTNRTVRVNNLSAHVKEEHIRNAFSNATNIKRVEKGEEFYWLIEFATEAEAAAVLEKKYSSIEGEKGVIVNPMVRENSRGSHRHSKGRQRGRGSRRSTGDDQHRNNKQQ